MSILENAELRDQILGEIRRLATATGKPPGRIQFEAKTGIAAHLWRGKFWARWGDALQEAGYGPNELTPRTETDQVLLGVIEACRYYGKFPTELEFRLCKQVGIDLPSHTTIFRHFGGRLGVLTALADYVRRNESYADIAAMLPTVPPSAVVKLTKSTDRAEGFVYLIQSGAFYKIGRSDDIERRVKQIRIALPDKAALIHSIRTDDPPGIEAYWHHRFAEKRANGEWFKLSPLDVSAFKKRKYQ